MKYINKLAIVIVSLLVNHVSLASVKNDQLLTIITNLPSFENFTTNNNFQDFDKKLNFNSDIEARKFKTLLTNGIKKGPNFASYLTIIEQGCGTNCQVQWVINCLTGNIITKFNTNLKAEYKIDSNLLILDPPTILLNDEMKKLKKQDQLPDIFSNIQTIYLVWDGIKFNKIKQFRTYDYLININF